jgi:branched-chain amino acid transport system substrate-binding protein
VALDNRGGERLKADTVPSLAGCTVGDARNVIVRPHMVIPDTSVIEGRIIVGPAGSLDQIVRDDSVPLRIGFLADVSANSQMGRYLNPVILALEDAINEGRLNQPVEILATHVVGLPVGKPGNVVAAYEDLVARGCLIVLSSGVTANALLLRDVINAAAVPYITMVPTPRFAGQHCFALPNGGIGEEGAVMASYLAERNLRRVVVTGECSPGDTEYQQYFREQARLYGIEIIKEHYFDQRPSNEEVEAGLRHWRDDLKPDALVYTSLGWNSAKFGPALKKIGWNPPRIMNAAIMWALGGGAWMEALDGWTGIEQTYGDHEDVAKNRNWNPMLDRHEKRFGDRPDTTLTAMCYDQGRAAAEALVNAASLTGEAVSAALERITMMPSTLGGPHTYIAFGPGDHRGYKGDFVFMKHLRDGKFHFAGHYWPQWPINAAG